MPSKHVRFSEVDKYYSPSPSPTFITTSLPSSPESPTFNHIGSPYAYTPLPPINGQLHPSLGPVRVNAILGFAPRPTFDWDLSLHPSSLHTPLPAQVLAKAATNPPLPSLTIISHHLPWSITVKPSSSTSSSSSPSHKPIHARTSAPYVTVADVLATLYRALRLPVLPAEYANLPSHKAKHGVCAAYHSRTHDSVEEAGKGVKRVDFLESHTSFLGLSSTTCGPDVWLLNVT